MSTTMNCLQHTISGVERGAAMAALRDAYQHDASLYERAGRHDLAICAEVVIVHLEAALGAVADVDHFLDKGTNPVT